MEEACDARFEYEVRDGRRLKFYAGQPGNYVGVTERKGKRKTSFYARACVTKRKGDRRRQYPIGVFGSAVQAAIAIAEAEASPCGPDSPEGVRKPRTSCALPSAHRSTFALSRCLMCPALEISCAWQPI